MPWKNSSQNALIDDFLNTSGLEPKFPKDLPEDLREGQTDYEAFHWQIRDSAQNPRVSKTLAKLPQKFPSVFRSLLERYRFAEFEVGPVMFLPIRLSHCLTIFRRASFETKDYSRHEPEFPTARETLIYLYRTYSLRTFFGMLRRTIYWKVIGQPMTIAAAARCRSSRSPWSLSPWPNPPASNLGAAGSPRIRAIAITTCFAKRSNLRSPGLRRKGLFPLRGVTLLT